MEHLIFILMISGISASISINMTGGKLQEEKIVRECDKEGLMCKDCNTLVYCQLQDFQFQEYVVSTCSVNVPCDETKKACTIGGACRYKEFVCPYNLPKEQYLPDPYSCNQYWRCKDGVHNKCGFPSSYNPISGECDLLMQESPYCLQDPLPPCQFNGQKLNMKGTPFNYECVEALPQAGIYPIIYPYLQLDSTNPTGNPNPIDTTGSPTMTTKQYPSYDCQYPGYFPYPPDCTVYYECLRNLDGTFSQTWLRCRIGSYFDEHAGKCVRGKCSQQRH